MAENLIHIAKIAHELKLQPNQVRAVRALLDDGATVPFMARYRKEATGSLDEVQIGTIRDRLEQLQEVDERREAILKSLEERNLLTDELKKKLGAASTLTVLEDIYQPFRPKKRTRATIAKEKGLEPLADFLFQNQADAAVDPVKEADRFVVKREEEEKSVATVEDALAGARDILAERMSDDESARTRMRELFQAKGVLSSKVMTGKEEEGAKFKDYFDWNEPAGKAPSHRILAIRRGESEGFLYFRIQPPEEVGLGIVESLFVRGKSPCAEQVKLAGHDGYKRLLKISMETEARIALKKRADEEAIKVFSDNIRELLMAAPLGRKKVLAIDPGFRTGCKIVCLDAQGKLLHHDVVYPEQGSRNASEAATKIRAYCQHFGIEAVAIGNGTAGRETEMFVRGLDLPKTITVVMVNESGASIYSASEVARQEFPDKDVTVRGAVSIGRRLMDPLAELVKIDAKSIGVGQYQHDVDQRALKRSLDDVVMSCVNNVGVELNTASPQILAYVSGLNAQLAENIVTYRNENGPFVDRQQLLNVPRLGPKTFQQAAGFLRIREGTQPLDASAVHPESYSIVDRMAADRGCTVNDLMRDVALRKDIRLESYITDAIGLPTLTDIMSELAKPGRDPREQFEAFSFTEGINKLEDLKPGLKLPGIVTNVTAFGAFVDIGVHQDGLVHISQLSDSFVKNPADVVKVHQKVQVTVVEVDLPRKRIALSMKSRPEIGSASSRSSDRSQGGKGQSGDRTSSTKPSQFGGDWFSQALRKGEK
ncbi:MAG: Tex family protein [Chthoniobacterales bacterium]